MVHWNTPQQFVPCFLNAPLGSVSYCLPGLPVNALGVCEGKCAHS